MTRFNEIQGRMWEQWFSLLKGSGPQAFEPSQFTGEGAIEAWREMADRFMRLQSDWLPALSPNGSGNR